MNDKKEREWAEISANPKFNMNHARCHRCGAKIYAPMPADCDMHEWGTYTWVILINAYLLSRGWKVVSPTDYFVCPNCIKKSDTFKKPVGSGLNANKHYLKWVEKMREKYDFHDE